MASVCSLLFVSLAQSAIIWLSVVAQESSNSNGKFILIISVHEHYFIVVSSMKCPLNSIKLLLLISFFEKVQYLKLNHSHSMSLKGTELCIRVHQIQPLVINLQVLRGQLTEHFSISIVGIVKEYLLAAEDSKSTAN